MPSTTNFKKPLLQLVVTKGEELGTSRVQTLLKDFSQLDLEVPFVTSVEQQDLGVVEGAVCPSCEKPMHLVRDSYGIYDFKCC